MITLDLTESKFSSSKPNLLTLNTPPKISFSELLKDINSSNNLLIKNKQIPEKEIKSKESQSVELKKVEVVNVKEVIKEIKPKTLNLENLLKEIKSKESQSVELKKVEVVNVKEVIKEIKPKTLNLENLLKEIKSKESQSVELKKVEVVNVKEVIKEIKPKNIDNLEKLLQGIENKDNNKNIQTTEIKEIKNPSVELKKVEVVNVKEVIKEIKPKTLNLENVLKEIKPKNIDNLEKLLQGIENKDNNKNIQTTEIKEIKNPIEELITLFKQDEPIPKKITELITPKEMKLLIADAKIYLKHKITNSEVYKNSEMKELPKTLKGLDIFAKSLGIDVRKITVEDVKNINQELKQQALKIPVTAQQISTKIVQSKEKVETSVGLEQLLKSVVETKKSVDNISTQIKSKIPEKTEEFKEIPIINIVTEKKLKENIKIDKKLEIVEDIKQFDIQKDVKTVKTEKLQQTMLQTPVTQTITSQSVPIENVTQRLEALLNSKRESNKSKDATQIVKSETAVIHKIDNFEIKLNEAKQMMKYLSSDVKTAIDDYKSPFTRIKVQLNPQRLGEVDLTVVQRGKKLHVNISSNNSAINTLAMNINELRIQLNSSGINNATINFNNSSQGTESNGSGQEGHTQQEQQQAKDEYNYFENEDQNEEILSSLEIIVPSYA